ncbi:hypothetical protein V1525DRAFT_452539 [Lipomyces kononenkoae]|uniref:Uncharacterized protein n=1 Tax=Lipomyces kononenkoae TaxID=34357 RepID=A0ACC3SSU5_LIPKO
MAEKLYQIEVDFPSDAVQYFKLQCTTSRVEGSHAALKGVLSSSSGTVFTAGKKIQTQGHHQAQRNRFIGANENTETAALATRISRSALDLIHTEVMKIFHAQDEAGSIESCNCDVYYRYLLPCRHRIQIGVPVDVTHIRPRWLVAQPQVQFDLAAAQVDSLSLEMRLPTSAEIVQTAADRADNVRRCKKYKEPLHNKRTCPRNACNESDNDMDEIDESEFATMWAGILP